MPRVHVERTCEIARTPRVIQVESMFDIPPAEKAHLEWDADLPLDERDWQIGLIVGPSGAGKSSIASELFPGKVREGFDWPVDVGIIDAFPKGMKTREIVDLLSAVGLSTPLTWLRPYHVLSNGERFRATVARALAEADDLVAIDEFTSVVDRQVAQIASHTIQKVVRRRGITKFVAISCHYDVLDWLQPDWVYEPHTATFEWRCLQRRPALDFEIYAADPSVWRVFAPHHYLSAALPHGSQCWAGYVNGHLAGFVSARRMPHPRRKNIWYVPRVVVLPDYQGLGIAMRLLEWLGERKYAERCRLHIITAHPGLVRSLLRSPRWESVTGRRSGLVFGRSADWSHGGRPNQRKLKSGEVLDLRALALQAFRYRPPKRA